jgi:erythromycin esterase-like protein
MRHYYTIQELVEFLENLDPLALEFADTEGALEATITRLKSQSDHIDWMRSRLVLAERVIGELYLMQREYEE